MCISSKALIQVECQHPFRHVVPMLSRVHAASKRVGPGSCIYSGAFVFITRLRLPIHQQGNGVFRPWNTVIRFSGSDALSGARDHAGGISFVLQDPTGYVDVVRG
jgi:hypothetical protein